MSEDAERTLPTTVQACIALLVQAGQDKAATTLRTHWFDNEGRRL